ncbi:uncharacterized protein B0H18DRAFT_1120485 [Fomitopsis serialis]|uniref:uncharacterized protein n=1 Tax=Fomitopsis serialis TaxID=139415 RepID=UPI002007DEF8|nr:uncharacterized protein B0H18DRAFT_1120485 [Neoantrodia serialis]KAH9923217.1 hypothetical protein B0H18DRAFT_1120485 [Neoantrodia serialis]
MCVFTFEHPGNEVVARTMIQRQITTLGQEQQQLDRASQQAINQLKLIRAQLKVQQERIVKNQESIDRSTAKTRSAQSVVRESLQECLSELDSIRTNRVQLEGHEDIVGQGEEAGETSQGRIRKRKRTTSLDAAGGEHSAAFSTDRMKSQGPLPAALFSMANLSCALSLPAYPQLFDANGGRRIDNGVLLPAYGPPPSSDAHQRPP